MSEYQERHTVSRLVGAPPGYVGYDEGGQLTEAVRRRPYSVVLLDEIEKAHNEVFDVLLQVLDDGRLTDGQGRTVDFRNTVLIMTSNIRTPDALRDFFRPEFLNRVDEIVRVQLALARADRRDRRAAARSPARAPGGPRSGPRSVRRGEGSRSPRPGWDPAYGARPLKRAIQRLLENPLALRLLEARLHRRRHDSRRRARRRAGVRAQGARGRNRVNLVRTSFERGSGVQRRGGSSTSSRKSAPSWRGGTP